MMIEKEALQQTADNCAPVFAPVLSSRQAQRVAGREVGGAAVGTLAAGIRRQAERQTPLPQLGMVQVPGARATVPFQPRIPVPVPAAKASPPTCPPGAGLQSKLKPPPSRPSLLLDGHKHTSNERESSTGRNKVGGRQSSKGGKESPSPDRLAHLPHLCNLARSNQRSYKLLDWTVPTRCSCPSVWPVCLPASFFRRIITNIPLSLFPSTHPVIIPSAAPCLLARLVSQADPGGSQFPSLHPRPRSSSYPPHH